ncbi:hypothetical protein MCC01992_07530 [Bifidobacteriaceae bacterium MCC01992]|nr:hypothetical protein MCC01992_07530 [Bifidobacteriaceae bacterium MCC01992]
MNLSFIARHTQSCLILSAWPLDSQASHANANKFCAFLLLQYHAHYVIRERSFGMAAARMGEHDFRNDYAPTDASHGFSRA